MRRKLMKVKFELFKYNDEYTCVKLLEGKYKGLEFIISELSIPEEEMNEEEPSISVEYFIVKHSEVTPVEEEDVKDYIIDVFMEMLEQFLTENENINE